MSVANEPSFDHRAAWGVEIGMWDRADDTRGFPSLDDGNIVFWDRPQPDGSLTLYGRENVNEPRPWYRVEVSAAKRAELMKEFKEHLDRHEGVAWFEKRGERFEESAKEEGKR